MQIGERKVLKLRYRALNRRPEKGEKSNSAAFQERKTPVMGRFLRIPKFTFGKKPRK